MARGRPRFKDVLTPREWDVLRHMSRGLTNEQITAQMGISLSGAKYHVSEILAKLEVPSREEAVAWARRERISRLAGGIFGGLSVARAGKLVAATGGVVLVGGLLVLFALGLHNQSAVSHTAPSLGRIAYVRDGDLWVKDLPSGRERRLTQTGGVLRPKWSADGEWLLYQQVPDLSSPILSTYNSGTMVISRDGTGARQIDADGLATWSPSGATLAFVLQDSSLVTEEADGSGRHEVLPPMQDRQQNDRRQTPKWTPDGLSIAFEEARQARPPDPTAPFALGYYGIRKVNADGTNEHEVFANGATPRGDVTLATWAPDGSTALLWVAPIFSASLRADGLPLAIAARPGPDHLPQDGPRGLVYDDYMDPAPAGTRVAYTDGAGRTASTGKAIAIIDLVTGAVTKLTRPDVAAFSPSWSPDAAFLAYVQAPASDAFGGDDALRAMSQRRIWLMKPDGTEAHALTPDIEQRQERPQWSRDGGTLLFVCMQGETASLCTVPAAGGPVATVVDRMTAPGGSQAGQFLYGYYGHVDWDYLFDWWRG